jgi:hypothetical protein
MRRRSREVSMRVVKAAAKGLDAKIECLLETASR